MSSTPPPSFYKSKTHSHFKRTQQTCARTLTWSLPRYECNCDKLNFKQARGIYWWLKHYFTVDECLYSYHLSALLYDWENQTYMHVDLHYSVNSKFTINWPPLSQSQWSNFVSHIMMKVIKYTTVSTFLKQVSTWEFNSSPFPWITSSHTGHNVVLIPEGPSSPPRGEFTGEPTNLSDDRVRNYNHNYST